MLSPTQMTNLEQLKHSDKSIVANSTVDGWNWSPRNGCPVAILSM